MAAEVRGKVMLPFQPPRIILYAIVGLRVTSSERNRTRKRFAVGFHYETYSTFM